MEVYLCQMAGHRARAEVLFLPGGGGVRVKG